MCEMGRENIKIRDQEEGEACGVLIFSQLGQSPKTEWDKIGSPILVPNGAPPWSIQP